MKHVTLLCVTFLLGGCAAYAPPPPATPGESHVVIAKPKWYPHEVQLHVRDGNEWKVACTGSCDQKLDTAREYRVDAPMMNASEPIRLTTAPKTEIAVQPTASYVAPLGGLVMGTAVGVGIFASYFGARAGVFEDAGACAVCTVVTGGMMIGSALLAFAGALIISHAYTKVEVSPLPGPKRAARLSP